MKLVIPTQPPFSFDQTLAFACRFAPLETAAIVEPDRLVAAFAHRGVAWACELRAPQGKLTLTVAEGAPAHVVDRATDLIGARDDLRAFYAIAAGDPRWLRSSNSSTGSITSGSSASRRSRSIA